MKMYEDEVPETLGVYSIREIEVVSDGRCFHTQSCQGFGWSDDRPNKSQHVDLMFYGQQARQLCEDLDCPVFNDRKAQVSFRIADVPLSAAGQLTSLGLDKIVLIVQNCLQGLDRKLLRLATWRPESMSA